MLCCREPPSSGSTGVIRLDLVCTTHQRVNSCIAPKEKHTYIWVDVCVVGLYTVILCVEPVENHVGWTVCCVGSQCVVSYVVGVRVVLSYTHHLTLCTCVRVHLKVFTSFSVA